MLARRGFPFCSAHRNFAEQNRVVNRPHSVALRKEAAMREPPIRH